MVNSAWDSFRENVNAKIDRVKGDSIFFNKGLFFGNIFRDKRILEARIKGIQRTLEQVDCAPIIILEQKLQQRYNGVLFREETLLYLKYGENQVKLEDRNTSFFHAQAVF